MSLRRAIDSYQQNYKDAVFGFIREHQKEFSINVPVMVRYQTLNYLLITEGFYNRDFPNSTENGESASNTDRTILTMDDARYAWDPTKVEWEMECGNVMIGAENTNEVHTWRFKVNKLEFTAPIHIEIGIQWDQDESRYIGRSLQIANLKHNIEPSLDRDIWAYITHTTRRGDSHKVSLCAEDVIEMELNGQTRTLSFHLPSAGFDDHGMFRTHIHYGQKPWKMYIMIGSYPIEIELEKYWCQAIDSNAVIDLTQN